MSPKSSSEGFNFAHTSFMVADPRSWKRLTVGLVVALVLALIIVIVLVVLFVVVKVGSPNATETHRDETSVITDKPGRNDGCFPEDSFVVTPRGKKRTKDLVLGDAVLDLAENGSFRYTEVYAWFRKSREYGTFLKLTTDDGSVIRLTGNHLIARYRWELIDNRSLDAYEIVLAREVRPGDRLVSVSSGQAINTEVIRVDESTGRGVYAPATRSGALFVDNVLVSCYTDYWVNGLVGHEFIHRVAMPPLRLLSSLVAPKIAVVLLEPTGDENLWFVEAWKSVDCVLSNVHNIFTSIKNSIHVLSVLC